MEATCAAQPQTGIVEDTQTTAPEQLAATGAAQGNTAAMAPNGTSDVAVAADSNVAGTVDTTPAVDPAMEALSTQLEACQTKPADFSGWTALITAAEKQGDLLLLRQVYDSFLAEYPLCYGYWKKYADAEDKYSSPEWAVHVYERGTAAVPYSVDLWGHFCMYKQSIGAAPDDVRALYEQGLAYVGSDYLAHGLWDKYVQYETSLGELPRVVALYMRTLAVPLRELELDRYFSSLKETISGLSVDEFMSAEERAGIEAAIAEKKKAAALAIQQQQAAAAGDVELAENGLAVAGMAATNGLAATEQGGAMPPAAIDAMEGVEMAGQKAASAAQASAQSPTAEEIKASWVGSQEALYLATREELLRRKPYEDAIKRFYFHVKPLDAAQLANWSQYLDYAERLGEAGMLVRLYERCLVACASYPEFWERYVRYLESYDRDSARAALQRAQTVHCKRNPKLLLYAARYEEQAGNVEAARAIYQHILGSLAPGLIAAVVQYANFERRQQNKEAACGAFEAALKEARGNEGAEQSFAFLTIQYAKFLQQAFNDEDAARWLYAEGLESNPQSKALWEGAIHLEEQSHDAAAVQRAFELYKRAGAPVPEGGKGLAEEEREDLSLRSIDFADMHYHAAAAKALQDAHAQQFKAFSSRAASKKRSAEALQSPEAKQARTETEAAAADPSAAYAASYAASMPAYSYAGYYGYATPQQYPMASSAAYNYAYSTAYPAA